MGMAYAIVGPVIVGIAIGAVNAQLKMRQAAEQAEG